MIRNLFVSLLGRLNNSAAVVGPIAPELVQRADVEPAKARLEQAIEILASEGSVMSSGSTKEIEEAGRVAVRRIEKEERKLLTSGYVRSLLRTRINEARTHTTAYEYNEQQIEAAFAKFMSAQSDQKVSLIDLRTSRQAVLDVIETAEADAAERIQRATAAALNKAPKKPRGKKARREKATA